MVRTIIRKHLLDRLNLITIVPSRHPVARKVGYTRNSRRGKEDRDGYDNIRMRDTKIPKEYLSTFDLGHGLGDGARHLSDASAGHHTVSISETLQIGGGGSQVTQYVEIRCACS
jgi:hypothetical protein